MIINEVMPFRFGMVVKSSRWPHGRRVFLCKGAAGKAGGVSQAICNHLI